MTVFNLPDFDNHEQISFFYDEKTGLKAIIAIHNTNRGPALGGCRFWNYACEEDALVDALRLSRGMTYKSALANLNLGGGKAVVIGDSKTQKTPERLASFGRFVHRLNGLYITAEDVGTSPEDMAIVHAQTPHVVGLSNTPGGSGDPSILTAYGVFVGIRGCVESKLNRSTLSGVHVAIQGLGHVGMHLAELLHQQGAKLTVTDINSDVLSKAQDLYQATVVESDSIYDVPCDVFAPCALGGVINDQTIYRLNCKIVAGSANNQLAESCHGDLLKSKGVLYAPDYLINAGGLINVTYEGPGYNHDTVVKHVDSIHETLMEIIDFSEKNNVSTNAASDQIAERRFRM